jgi:hypothetical protein
VSACLEIEKIVLSKDMMEEQPIGLSHFAEKIQYIPLEINDSSVIHRVDKVLFYAAFCVVIDSKSSAIFVFDTVGHFIRKIEHYGKGPGEYLKIADAAISKDGNIYVVDSEQSKLICYSLEGKIIAEASHFPERSFRVATLQEEDIVTWLPRGQFVHNKHFSLAVYNQSMEKINRMVDRSSEQLTVKDAWEMPFYKASILETYLDTLTFWEFRYDTVYRIIDAKTYFPRYYLDYEDKMPMDVIFTDPEAVNYTNIRNYLEIDQYIFFYGSNHNKVIQIVYNKREKTGKRIPFTWYGTEILGAQNDIDGGWNFWPMDVVDSNRVYDVFYACDVKECMDNGEILCKSPLNPVLYDKMRQMAKSSTIMDNPIIAIVTCKE